MAFDPGDRIRTRAMNPEGHTRLPAYLRGREGTIERAIGAFPFSDDRAAGRPYDRQMLYTVRFDGAEIWGKDAEPESSICADLFESYLEALT
jgi:nitrile hydratase